MVTYIRSDLDFILQQIKISEAHAAGQPLYGPGGLIPSYNIAWGLRTVDGSYNHLLPGQEEWGASDQPFPEGLGNVYRDATATSIDMNGPAPGGVVPTAPTYAPSNDPGNTVIDSSVRTISNLIVDQTLANPAAILVALDQAGTPGDHMAITAQIQALFAPIEGLFLALDAATVVSTAARAAADANPTDPDLEAAAVAAEQATADAQAALDGARTTLDAALADNGITMDGNNVSITNVAPDEGLSAPFNSWFTLFGQFFDHGLDLVNKGGSGTVFIPLEPDDPLYDPASSTNFMVLTRATTTPGADGIMGTADDVRPINHTTAYVDQNQTYTSHASHQVFLRDYALDADGRPMATGNLIEGANGGMATWAEVKAQALMLGIRLEDRDVGSVPLLRTDQYGKFIPNADGYAQLIVGVGDDGIPNTADDVVVSGTPTAPIVPTDVLALRTGHAFLADIAHNAVPTGLADGDIEVGLGNGDGSATDGFYDNELLDAHYIAGDGRANENIGLTAVHHVFHSEHNRLVQHTKDVVLASGDIAFINEWLTEDIGAIPADLSTLVWDGDRLFQAAKFGTEMQYQHLVFEEFARKVAPSINVFLVPDGFDTTLNPSIVAEFAHVVYRFGHSMLTETIDRFDPSFNASHIGLIEGFLNPLQFDQNGTGAHVDHDIGAGAIIRGMTRQVGNGIDEFVTTALRNNLLGLPLDLATINLARGRDTGVPPLNEVRAQYYEASNQNILLKPYESWVDFAGHLKNEASIINFIASYGTHELITSQTTLEGKRDAALTIITGVSVGGLAVPADALDFLNATGAYAGGVLGGLNNVDLWIGGLAEETMPFGGMLGSTFAYTFEIQLEALQSGDRFYYLQRLDGLHLFGEMENNSFAAMMMRNTNATHLPADVFSVPGFILEVDKSQQFNLGTGVFTAGADGILGTADDVEDTNADPAGGGLLTPLVIRNNPATAGADTNYLRYTGGDHVVLGGTNAADILIAGIGDDTLYGDGGNDRLEGGFGNDIINGGDGDDIITDAGGDDNVKGGAGNDVIHAGGGLDLVLAGDGKDFVFLGTDMGSEVFAGQGDDFIYGNKNAERILGNEGNDWIETGTFDGAPGDNFDEVFAHDTIDGHDVFLGDGGFDEFIGEGGDDIMVGSPGRGKMAGMSGFDWATYKDSALGVNADLSIPIVFDEAPTIPGNAALDEYQAMEGLSGSAGNDVLRGSNATAADRLSVAEGGDGAEGYLGSELDAAGIALIQGLQAVVGAGVTQYSAGDIILGGDGNDLMAGQQGDDILDGDKWLDVYIGVTGHPTITRANSMTELASRMFSGEINPSQLQIVREIVTANGVGDIDTALFSGARAEYRFGVDSLGRMTVTHTGGTQLDGTDVLMNMERAQFADQTISIANVAATGAPGVSDTTPTEGQAITANVGTIADANGFVPGNVSYQWQVDNGAGTFVNIGGATASSFTPVQAQVNRAIRVVASFTDALGFIEQRVSAATTVVGDLYVGTAGVNIFNGTAGEDNASGLGGNDTLSGNAGNDILNGGTGNDTLDGGAGDDTMIGGTDNDTYMVDAAGDVVTEAAGQGTDSVETTLAAYTLGANVENLAYIGAGAFAGTGNALNNLIEGGSGDNTLSGLDGNDTLIGLGGNDNLDGGNGNDTLLGGLGADTLIGGAGADRLDGGAGNDTMSGGADNDTYVVDAAGDTVTEVAGQGVDTVETSLTSYTLGASLDNLTYTGAAAFTGTGNVLNNVIQGGSGANTLNGLDGADTLNGQGGNDLLNGGTGNDVLSGGVGNDTLDGGTGNDAMTGGTGNDIFVVDSLTDAVNEGGGGGTDTVQTTLATYTLGANVENLTKIGGGTFTGTGNALNNILDGGTGANTLNGLAGNDTLNGQGGQDTLNGGAGNDVLNGGIANDRLFGGIGADNLTGGAGNDTFVFTAIAESGTTAGTRDTITAFDGRGAAAGDLIDLSAFAGTFAFIGGAAFGNGAQNQVRFVTQGANTVIQIDNDNSNDVDATILLIGTGALTAADFVL
jgi:Ca2+-binding RTX toxin-like protein